MTSRSTAKTVTMAALGYRGDPSPTPYDYPFPKLGLTTPSPPSKTALQIVTKQCRINGGLY